MKQQYFKNMIFKKYFDLTCFPAQLNNPEADQKIKSLS